MMLNFSTHNSGIAREVRKYRHILASLIGQTDMLVLLATNGIVAKLANEPHVSAAE
jgi:hypothetical protein